MLLPIVTDSLRLSFLLQLIPWGNSAFAACQGLTSIFAYRTKPIDLSSTTGVFDYVDKKNCILYVPDGSIDTYKSANQWKDFANIREKEYLTLSSNVLSIGASEGSTETVIATSNTSWTTSSDQTWLSISPKSGNNIATLTLTAKANPTISPRTAIVTIIPTNAEIQHITVLQAAGDATLSVSVNDVHIEAKEGSTSTINLTSNTVWTASSDQTWLTLNPESGEGDRILTFTATVNLESMPRSATVKISGLGVSSQTITVTQATLYILKVHITKKWNDVLICDNSANEYVSYKWYKNSIAIENAIQQFYYQPNGLSGNYYVEVSNAKGERGFSNIIDISSQKQGKILNIFPNPSNVNEKMTIEIDLSNDELRESQILIYNIGGKLIQKIDAPMGKIAEQFYRAGTYFIQLKSRNGKVKETSKFIINQ